MHIYLDLDGVCVDLHQGIADLLNVELPDPWPTPGEDNWPVAFGLQSHEIWSRVNASAESFWESLPKTSLCDPLVELLQGHKCYVTIFTQLLAHKSGGYSGKLRWCERHLPKDWGFLCSPKKVASMAVLDSSKLLIDDNEENCRNWFAKGGRPISIPRPWNWYKKNEPDANVLSLVKAYL